MEAIIITVGTEILMGELIDTNSSFLANELPSLGISLKKTVSVGDRMSDITEEIDTALRSADVVMLTGGLGPTSDDLTRESIAEFCGEEMSLDPEQLTILEEVFRNRGQTTMPKTNLKQAFVIPSSSVLSNPNGTAPGWFVKKSGKCIIAMPGPPSELQAMWKSQVCPRLRDMTKDVVYISRNIKTFGMSEGAIDEMLGHLFGKDNPFLGIYSKQDGIHLRIIAHANSVKKAQSLIDPLDMEIHKSLNSSVWGYGEDTPAQILVNELKAQKRNLVVTEGFTKGIICSFLSEAPGASEILNGGFIPGLNATEPAAEFFTSHDGNENSPIHIKVSNEATASASQNSLEEISIHVSVGEISDISVVSVRNQSLRVRQRTANQAMLIALKVLRTLD